MKTQEEILRHRLEMLEAESAWLLTRAARAGQPARERDDVSIAANALVSFVMDGPEPARPSYPRDTAELATCCRAYLRAPRHLQPAMRPLLLRYYGHVRQVQVESEAWDPFPVLAQVEGYLRQESACMKAA